ncbi:endonuclease/exonuclease/phosphatase family protein [Actinoplanes sp. NPDC089786]|uniref:endonuclease/exonuclease/phosphatase family protein n=1 Tax=Actinoplanes sp. NPDC089786 TaxID=3155185 RepID=UPI00342A6F6A
MRVMTWNILVGGQDRLGAILDVVRRERPDVLALQELKGWSAKRVGEVAGELGMTAHLAPSVFGQPVAVLARTALTRTRSITWRLHHAAAVATVGDLTVVSTHLNPFSPERRRREATWLAACFFRTRRKVLIAGDLNSLDPGTDHAEALAVIDQRYQRRHLTPAGTADTRAIRALLDAGFVDVGRGIGATVPTARYREREFGEFRLDYLMASPPLARLTRYVSVRRDEVTDRASDHYPVVASFSDETEQPAG